MPCAAWARPPAPCWPQAGIAPEQVDLIVPHQANVRIIFETLAKRMNAAMEGDGQHRAVRQHLRRPPCLSPCAKRWSRAGSSRTAACSPPPSGARPDLGCRPHQVGRARHPLALCATTSCPSRQQSALELIAHAAGLLQRARNPTPDALPKWSMEGGGAALFYARVYAVPSPPHAGLRP